MDQPAIRTSLRDVVRHYYGHHLGRMSAAHDVTVADGCISVCEYRRTPGWGSVTLATAGLSELMRPLDGDELMLATKKKYWSAQLVNLLAAVAVFVFERSRENQTALLEGTLIPAGGPVASGSLMRTLCVAPPLVYSENLWRMLSPAGEVRFWWLVPVHPSEADWLRRRAFADFARELEKVDPDLLDLCREPMPLPQS